MKKIVALIAFSIIMLSGGMWLSNYKKNLPVPATRTDTEIIKAIQKSTPRLFSKDNEPIFSVVNISHPQKNWYIVTITKKGETGGIKSKLIISDPYFGAEYMNVIKGPSSTFAENELKNLFLPDEVVKGVKNEK